MDGWTDSDNSDMVQINTLMIIQVKLKG